MKELILVRDELRDSPDGPAREGRLYVDDTILGPTIERVAVMIAHGTFPIAYHSSEKHPRSIMLMVPGRKFILIHPGGRPAHSEGCVLLGANDLEGAAISGGAPRCSWLADLVFGSKTWKEGEIVPDWQVKVLEPAGNFAT